MESPMALGNSSLEGSAPDRATLRRRTYDVHSRALRALKGAQYSIGAALEALHPEKEESFNETLRAYKQATERPSWAPKHVPNDAVGNRPCLHTANDHIESAKADIHEAFGLLPTLRLAHGELNAAACGDPIACCPKAGVVAAPSEGGAVQECVTFLQKLQKEVEQCIAWLHCNRSVYEHGI